MNVIDRSKERWHGRLIASALPAAVGLLAFVLLPLADALGQETVNLAIPTKSFQQVIYPLAQERGFMREEGIDLKIIFVEPTPSVQALLARSVHFTAAGTSALLAITRANAPLKVVLANNDRVLQWLLQAPSNVWRIPWPASRLPLPGPRLPLRRWRRRPPSLFGPRPHRRQQRPRRPRKARRPEASWRIWWCGAGP